MYTMYVLCLCLVVLQSVVFTAARVDIVSEKTIYEVGETIEINCTSPSHSALYIEWYFNSRPVPTHLFDVISADLSQLTVPDSNFSHAGNYSCALLGDLLEEVATVQIEVGAKPHPAANFSCHSFNAFDILCTWDEGGATNIPTTHSLKYKSLYFGGGWKNCPDETRSVDCPGIHDYTYSCHMDAASGHHEGNRHNFTVIAENALGVTHTSIFFNPEAEAIPFSPEDVSAIGVDNSCIEISWEFPCGWVHEFGEWFYLQYQLRWKSEWEPDQWQPLEPIKQDYARSRRQCGLEGYTEYEVQVSAALTGQDLYWGDWSDAITVRTLEQAPISRLEVFYGNSQDNSEDSTKRDVTIHWKPLGPRQMKGEVLRYALTLNEDGSNDTQEVNTSADAISHEFQALKKYSSYSVTVVTFNSIGSSPPTTLRILGLSSAPSEPRSVTAEVKDKNSITVSWDPPLYPRGIIQEYKIYWRRTGEEKLYFDTVPLSYPSQELKYDVTGLEEYVQYEFHVQAFTTIGGGGLSEVAYQYTLEGVPSGPPRHIQVEPIDDPTRLQLTWQPPCLEERKGIIRGYILYYCQLQNLSSSLSCQDSTTGMHNVSAEASHEVMVVELDELKPFTEYAVWLSAYTSIGISGPNSTEMWNRTSEGTPSAPRGVKVTNRTATEITLEWQPPSEPNGIVENYVVRYNSESIVANQTRVTLMQLLGYTTYVVTVQACTGAASTPCGDESDEVRPQTLIGVPGKPSPPVVSLKSPGSAVLTVAALSTPGGPAEHVKYWVFYKKPGDAEYLEHTSVAATRQISSSAGAYTYAVEVRIECDDVKTDADYVFAVAAVNSRGDELLVGQMSDPSGSVKLCYHKPDIAVIVALIIVGTILAIALILCVTFSWRKYKKSEFALPVPAAKLPPLETYNERDPDRKYTDDTREVYDVLQNHRVDATQLSNGYGPQSRYQRQSSGGCSDTSQRSDSRLIRDTDRDAPIDEDEDEVFPLQFQDYHKSRKHPLRINIPKHYVNSNHQDAGLLAIHSPDSGFMAGSPGYTVVHDQLPLVGFSSTGSSQDGSVSEHLQMSDFSNGRNDPPHPQQGNRLTSIDSGFGFNCLSPTDSSAPISISGFLPSETTNVNYSQLSPDGKLAPVSLDESGGSHVAVDIDSGHCPESVDYQQLSPEGKLAPVTVLCPEDDRPSADDQIGGGLEYSRIAADGTLSPVRKSEPNVHFKRDMIVPPADVTVMSVHGATSGQDGDTCYVSEENMKNPTSSPAKDRVPGGEISLDSSKDTSGSAGHSGERGGKIKSDAPPASEYVPIEEPMPTKDRLCMRDINQIDNPAHSNRVHIHALLDNPNYVPSIGHAPDTDNNHRTPVHSEKPGYVNSRPAEPAPSSSGPVYVNIDSAPSDTNTDTQDSGDRPHYVNDSVTKGSPADAAGDVKSKPRTNSTPHEYIIQDSVANPNPTNKPVADGQYVQHADV